MGDFNWLKNITKNNQKLLSILHHQKNLFSLCVYKMDTFALFTTEAWKKMMLKLQNMVVKYG